MIAESNVNGVGRDRKLVQVCSIRSLGQLCSWTEGRASLILPAFCQDDCFIFETVAGIGSGSHHPGVAVKQFGFGRDPLFLMGCAAYAVNRWLLKPHFHSVFLHSYFNDLWLIPCALPLLLYVHWRLALRASGPPTFLEIAGHLILWSMLFEWWGPKFWPKAVGDIRDVYCYWTGGIAAWLWWNRVRMARPFFEESGEL
jgi:hypothetical protein